MRAGDVVAGPYAAASSAPVADSDTAAVAARAHHEFVGQKIPLTRPQGYTNFGLVKIIGTVLDRPVQYQEVPTVLRQPFIGLGLGAEFARAYVTMLAEALDKPALVTHDVEKIVERPALTFAQWVSKRRSLFTK